MKDDNDEEKKVAIPDDPAVDWDIDPSKACDLSDPECEACQ